MTKTLHRWTVQSRNGALAAIGGSALALTIGWGLTAAWGTWQAVAASAQGLASVVIVAPSAVSSQTDIIINTQPNFVSGANFSVGASPEGDSDSGSSSLPFSPPAGRTSAQPASFGVFGSANQVFSVNVPSSAIMMSGTQMVEVGGLRHTAGTGPSVGQTGSGTVGIEFSEARVTTLLDLGEGASGVPVLPDLTESFGAPQSGADGDSDVADDGTPGTKRSRIVRSNPFQAVNNVGPYFYVTISYN